MTASQGSKVELLNSQLEASLRKANGSYSSIDMISGRGVLRYEASILSLQLLPESDGISIVGRARVDLAVMRVDRVAFNYKVKPSRLEFTAEDSPFMVAEMHKEQVANEPKVAGDVVIPGFKHMVSEPTHTDFVENAIPRYFFRAGSLSDNYRQDLSRRALKNGMELEARVLDILFGRLDKYHEQFMKEFYSGQVL